MKKVAFLTHTLDGGGAERVISNLSQRLSSKYDVVIMLLDGSKVSYPHGGRLVDVWSDHALDHDNTSRDFNPLQLIQMLRSLRKALREERVDLLISFLEIPNLLNFLTNGSHRRIVSVRNHMSGKNKGLLGRLALNLVHRFTERTIAVSELIRIDLIENFGADPERISVINNPVDKEAIDDLKKGDIGIDDEIWRGRPVIINIGRLTPSKGQDLLIRAFSKVQDTFPGARLVILGEGPEESRLKSVIEMMGLKNRVVLLGFQKNPYAFLYRSDLFVLSSHHEGFPNSMLEAMACGLPVVSVDCPSGPREILAPDGDMTLVTEDTEMARFGILTPPWTEGDSAEECLVEAIKSILSDDELRESYSLLSIERAGDFSIDAAVSQWEDEISLILKSSDI